MERIFKNQQTGDYFWNSLAGLLNAGQSVLILMVITRVCGLAQAGVFSIAFATANLWMYLGNFGVRNYQVSDQKRQNSYSDYLRHRELTVLLMFLCFSAQCWWNEKFGGYDLEKTAVVMAMCMLKCIDCVEDVYAGRLQQKGRLDLAGKVISLRLVTSIGTMLVVLVVTRDLLVSTVAAIAAAALCLGIVLPRFKGIINERDNGNRVYGNLRGIMKDCLPVCAANFLSFFIINSPKYAIDVHMTSEAQAYYGFIAMPVFVIQLLGMFIYQPLIVKMTVVWTDRHMKDFIRYIRQVLGLILAVSVICLACAWLFGIPVLSLLYSEDLGHLRTELMILLFGSVFLAVNSFLCAVLTIARAQKRIAWIYLVSAVMAAVLAPLFVRQGGIRGGAAAFVIVMAATAVQLSLLLRKHCRTA